MRPTTVTYALSFGVAFVSALLLTPLVRDIARSAGLVDTSDGDRKIHEHPVPRLGGIAIVTSLFVAMGVLLLDPAWFPIAMHRPFFTILVGGLAMHLLGVADDLLSMRARYKLLGQVVIAASVWGAGVRMNVISLPFVPELTLPLPLDALITVMWLVGVTNAFNLIDGVDGLAAGAALVALLTMSAIGIVNHQWAATWITLTIAGATLGVLVYNFPPASIFLGDAGSLFLGFMLAGSGLLSAQKSSTTVAVAVPLLVLGLPVLDTGLAIVRRFLRGQAIFIPDRGHIHHRLLNRGLSARAVTLVLCAVCGVLGLAGFALLTRPEFQVLVLVLLGLGAGLFVHQLRIQEFEALAGTIVRGAQRQVIQRTVRIREAGSRIRDLNDVDNVLESLAGVLEVAGFEHAELLLRRHFIERGPGPHVADASQTEELVVWSCGDEIASETAWELCVPLTTSRAERIGSLRVQQHPAVRDQSLAHWSALAIHIGCQLGLKLEELWPSDVAAARTASTHHEPRFRTNRRSAQGAART